MIAWVLSVVKSIDGTGSTQLLLAGILPGLLIAFVWPRSRAWARRWFLAAGAIYLMLTLPIIANALAAPLAYRGDRYRVTTGPLDALVIFDGDNRRGRINTAKAIFDASAPEVVWVLSLEPEWFQDELPVTGIPADRVHYDVMNETTRAQVSWVARYRSEHPTSAITVVVSRLQAARVAGLTAAMHISDISLVGTPVNREPAASGVWRLVPSVAAWRVSTDSLYEHAALVYYARNGWIDR